MKKIILLLILMTIIQYAFSQAPDWTRVLQVNTFGPQIGNVVTADENNVIMAGNVSGPFTFEGKSFVCTGAHDLILVKANAAGGTGWVKTFSAAASGSIIPYAIKMDGDKNIFLAATLDGTVTIGSNTISSSITTNAFIAKIDANGNGLWATAFFAPGTAGGKIENDKYGNCYLLSMSCKLLKFGPTGTLIWEQVYPYKTLQALAINNSSLYVGGSLQPGTTNFGTLALESNQEAFKSFIVKGNLEGIYSKYTTGSSLTGSTKSGFYSAVGTFNHPTAGIRNINMTKELSGVSENLLMTSVGDLAASSGELDLTINPDNSISYAGSYVSTFAVVATPGAENRYDPATRKFYLNYQYTSSGTRIISEVLTYSSPGANNQTAGSTVSDLKFDNNGNILTTGFYSGALNFGTISATTGTHTYIAKCDTNLVFSWINSSSTVSQSDDKFAYRLFIDSSNNIFQYGKNNAAFSFGTVSIPNGSSQFLIKSDTNGIPQSGFNIPVASGFPFVTPIGKIACTGTANSNFFLTLYNNSLVSEWTKSSISTLIGGASIISVRHDAKGNTYLLATVNGNCNYFGNIIISSNQITVFSKHDLSGKVLWMKQLSNFYVTDQYHPLTIDKDNNAIITGLFSNNQSIENFSFYNQNAYADELVVKYNGDGTLLWARQIETTGDAVPTSVTTDYAGNVIISGTFYSQMTVAGTTIDTGSAQAIYLIKFNPAGNALFNKYFPITNGSPYRSILSSDLNNNIYLGGDIQLNSSSLMTFGNVSSPQPNYGGSVLVKLDAVGTPLWVRVLGDAGSYADWADFIKTDKDGNTYLVGDLYAASDKIGAIELSSPFGSLISSSYLAKVNTSGEVEWAKAIHYKSGSIEYKFPILDIDPAGNAYIGAYFSDSISIEGNKFKAEGAKDFYVAKYSSSGSYQWVKTIPANAKIIFSISVLRDNVLTVAGFAGKNPTLGSFAIQKKGGSSCIAATIGDFPYLNTSSNQISLEAANNSASTVNITSNTDWTAAVDQNWVTIDLQSGTGNKTIEIIATANPNPTSRSAFLNLSIAGTIIKTVQITQNGFNTPTTHYAPVWTGNGVDHMNINIYSAKLDGIELEAGDEVAIFDGTLCVGVGKLTGPISNTSTLDIAVSRNDGSGNGYVVGNTITFKFFDTSKAQELANVTATYATDNPIWSTDGKFAIGATAFASLAGLTKVNQDITMSTGWNIISTYTIPANLDLMAIFQPLITAGKLKKVMDEAGKTIENFGAFGGWKNNIGNLSSSKGYKVNVAANSTLSLEGLPVQLPFDISLAAGWNIISYPSASAQDAKALVQPLIDNSKLLKIMDEAGKTIENFGAFGGWKNNIGNFIPGKGYKVNVSTTCTLTITGSATKAAVIVPEVLASDHFAKVYTGNGTDHFNVHLVDLASSGLVAGDQIGIFDGNYCVGSATIGHDQLMSGTLSIPSSFNDELTGKVNGFTVGHPVTLQLYRDNQAYPLTPSIVTGSQAFEKNGSLFVKVVASDLPVPKISVGYDQVKCYPNPFADQLTIEIRLTQPKNLEVKIYDLSGKLVRSLYNGEAGTSETLTWDGTNGQGTRMISGTYILKANEMIEKVALKK